MKHIFLGMFLLFAIVNAAQAQSEQWTNLFNGKDLKGWKANENTKSFRVEHGLLVCSGARGHLFYRDELQNFELEAELKSAPMTNSGLFFHTAFQKKGWLQQGYEVKINNTNDALRRGKASPKSGSLSAIRNVYFPMAVNGDWMKLRVKVVENRVEIFVNDQKVVDYIQPDRPWRSLEHKGRLLGKGLLALESRDAGGTVWYRSIKIRKLPAAEKSPMKVTAAWDETVTRLADQGFPLVDFHVHLKGGLTLDQVKERSLELGINYGVAPNCGLKFPVTNDATLALYMDTVKGQPIFRGMQAEGREWITLFSPKAIAKFDYVFTDAMTFTDAKGRRNRIWLPDEVWVDDKQQFMEQLVQKIEAIFSQEPVDIYVNPTVLPAVLMPEYDQLWTQERMERVIKVLAANHIVLEINARYKTPHAALIRMAKKAGIKFTFGTNNNTNQLGQLEYCLQMIQECGLTPEDIFMPKPDAQKPVLVKGLPKKITG